MRTLSASLCVLSVLLFLATAGAASPPPAVIRVVQIDGEAFAASSDDAERARLTSGDSVAAGATVLTGSDSRLVLLFSNGATTSIGPDASLKIDEFLYDGRGGRNPDPNPSTTELSVDYGEMFGNVERLDDRSRLNVKTPVGTAGIRGTTFRVRFDPHAGLCVVSNIRGHVEWESAGDITRINPGEELVITLRTRDDGSFEVIERAIGAVDRQDVQRAVRALREGISARISGRLGERQRSPLVPFDGSILSPSR